MADELKKDLSATEDNSFFENEYKEYLQKKKKKKKESDSCATASLTMNDITELFGIEQTQMLRDYETAATDMSDVTREMHLKVDRKIDELSVSEPQEVRSDYIFDSEELTIGELIAINDEILRKQEELEQSRTEPHLTSLIRTQPDGIVSKISVISIPSESVISEESAFIALDEVADE